ncbi:MAG: hypothetical protein JSW66_18065 [Phycisphaerales bacterium]|nr:MAG: hypothetical protein JSW66_18065 [Phycisphaerales bacterium]
MIKFHCEHCGHKITVEDVHTGKRGRCPACGEVFVAPAASTVIQFHCQNCGRQLAAPKIHGGKRLACPKCGDTVVVPTGRETPARSVRTICFTCSTCHREIEEPESSRGKLIECPHCGSYVAVPSEEISAQQAEVTSRQDIRDDASGEHFEQMQRGMGRMPVRESDPVVERKLPWILDIFLYPTSKTGLTILGIVVVVRVTFRIVVRFLGVASQQFLPCLAFFGLMWGVGLLVRIVLYLYLYWYLCECIRESAAGGIRAPETAGRSAGVGEMLWQVMMTSGCFIFCLGPALFYFIEARETDIIFWCLAVYAVVFFPMSFLAVVLLESWRGLNPILLGRSILSTFLPYCAMIAAFGSAGLFIVDRAPNPWASSLSLFVTFCLGGYLAMVVAHLLGWFYHRYAEELDWGV